MGFSSRKERVVLAVELEGAMGVDQTMGKCDWRWCISMGVRYTRDQGRYQNMGWAVEPPPKMRRQPGPGSELVGGAFLTWGLGIQVREGAIDEEGCFCGPPSRCFLTAR